MAKVSAADAAVFEEAAASSSKQPTEDALEKLRDHVRTARDLAMEIADRSAALNELKQQQFRLLTDTLPAMFMDLGIDGINLSAEGNMPAYEATCTPHFKAVIAASWDDDRRAAAFKWLRDNKLGELVKAEYTVEFGKDTQKQQKTLRDFLKKNKIDYEAHESAAWNALTAALRRLAKAGQPLPDTTLGIERGNVVTIKEIKPK